jgi:hypothetical protein
LKPENPQKMVAYKGSIPSIFGVIIQ